MSEAQASAKCKGLGKFGNLTGWRLPSGGEITSLKPGGAAWVSGGKVWNGSAVVKVLAPKIDPRRPAPPPTARGTFCVTDKK